MGGGQMKRRGLMLVLSSPSGAGKTTLSRLLLESDPAIQMSVSATTRKPRAGEIEGRDYYFIDGTEFERRAKANEFLEHANVFDHRYGTPKKAVERSTVPFRLSPVSVSPSPSHQRLCEK